MNNEDRSRVAAVFREALDASSNLGDAGDRINEDDRIIRAACEAHCFAVYERDEYNPVDESDRVSSYRRALEMVERQKWP